MMRLPIGIIKKYQQKYHCKTILRETNYYSQKNKIGDKPIIEAMNMASGKYIAVVDSDDLIVRTKIAHQVNILEKNPHCVMCYSAIEVIMPDGVFPTAIYFLMAMFFIICWCLAISVFISDR